MTKVRFSKDFDFKPTAQSTIGYMSGWTGSVTQACAKAAEASGAGEILEAETPPAPAPKLGKANG